MKLYEVNDDRNGRLRWDEITWWAVWASSEAEAMSLAVVNFYSVPSALRKEILEALK